jgi:hypothetical protein
MEGKYKVYHMASCASMNLRYSFHSGEIPMLIALKNNNT